MHKLKLVPHAKPLVTMYPLTCRLLTPFRRAIKFHHLFLLSSDEKTPFFFIRSTVNLISTVYLSPMADRDRPHQIQVHPTYPHRDIRLDTGGDRSRISRKGPSAAQIMALITLLPVGGTLLALAGFTLAGTVIGLIVATPLFILFSPVLVPAAIGIGLAVAGFFTSGAFGLTGLSSLSWVLNLFRHGRSVPEIADQAKRRAADVVGYVGQKTKEVGQDIQTKAQETKTGGGGVGGGGATATAGVGGGAGRDRST